MSLKSLDSPIRHGAALRVPPSSGSLGVRLNDLTLARTPKLPLEGGTRNQFAHRPGSGVRLLDGGGEDAKEFFNGGDAFEGLLHAVIGEGLHAAAPADAIRAAGAGNRQGSPA